MATALITHEACHGHVAPEGMPERVGRLKAVLAALDDLDLVRVDAPEAGPAEVLALHTAGHVDHVEGSVPASGFAGLDKGTDAETFLCPTSLEAVYRAVGGALRGVDMVLAGDVQNAFVATRPPGHHAEADKAMGFCIFGNVALAARHALEAHGLSRVAVVDFDVHHGNGTQALLWDEPRALVVTSQQMPLWPGTGYPEERGPHDTILNVPLAPGSDGAAMRSVYERVVFPRLRAFAPELILISAGFDAHEADPLAQLRWVEEDFAWLTRELCALARELCDGRVVSCLEGGYDLQALAASARVHVIEMMEAP
ncbi:histone deacetylase family protein [Pseudaestuariivita sp.]|uniref:histone deacetylase family protein n=1 Tax=Pseudaestuariivita sp. TaxID=2211669 RepID=UPI004058EAD2